MRIPNAENAIIDIRKLKDYCLNPIHEVGEHKARIFESAFSLGPEDFSILQTALLDAIKLNEAEIGKRDKFGQRYIVDFDFERKMKVGRIRSVWIIDVGSYRPRLVTCYPL